jgi:hypothetical protein
MKRRPAKPNVQGGMPHDGWVSRNSTGGGSDPIVLIYIYEMVVLPLSWTGYFTGADHRAMPPHGFP